VFFHYASTSETTGKGAHREGGATGLCIVYCTLSAHQYLSLP
jgi:hypothetical protein